ncbi:hypothetical protein [Flavobacterium sp.]|uniref:hypothetical protein n=1 Tax=Flavobacterium sp. TaxID=239 RepID=UPI0022CCA4FB|nr:hypothetical protein [Flavobacterium sp.]MCZ8229193.1 hypothetical protein [Flavobacterium sp.]
MEKLNTKQVIEKIKVIEPNGIEVRLQMGILTSTKAIYYKKNMVYLFSIDEVFKFSIERGMKKKYFLEKHSNWIWQIEQIIS